MQQTIFIADFIACSTCFGQHYAHHQGLESIIQMVAACGIWCFGLQDVGMVWSWGLCVRFAGCKPDTLPPAPHHTDNLKTKTSNTTGSDHLYNTLELLMMGIVLPETCWACNKLCNKYHLLHLVGILFPHRSFNRIFKDRDLQIPGARSRGRLNFTVDPHYSTCFTWLFAAWNFRWSIYFWNICTHLLKG